MLIVIALITLSLADFGTTVLFTRHFGPAVTYTLFAVPMLIGLSLQWRSFRQKRWDVEETEEEKWERHPQRVTGLFMWMLITVLLLIPGLVTATAAFLLMFSPLRKPVEARFLTFCTRARDAAKAEEIEQGSRLEAERAEAVRKAIEAQQLTEP